VLGTWVSCVKSVEPTVNRFGSNSRAVGAGVLMGVQIPKRRLSEEEHVPNTISLAQRTLILATAVVQDGTQPIPLQLSGGVAQQRCGLSSDYFGHLLCAGRGWPSPVLNSTCAPRWLYGMQSSPFTFMRNRFCCEQVGHTDCFVSQANNSRVLHGISARMRMCILQSGMWREWKCYCLCNQKLWKSHEIYFCFVNRTH